jgi:hypothetical protein
MRITIMKRLALAILLVGVAGSAYASQEGTLPISSFRLESDGAGASGKITVEGKQNAKAQLIELKIKAFGKDYVVPAKKLGLLAELRANGIRISYESGYKELGGKTVYIQLQMGFTSHTLQTALITITENGEIEVSEVQDQTPARPDDANMVKAEATVVRYIPQAMHESYDDGRNVTFDAVELRLTAPQEWLGSNLVVHFTSGNTNPLFRRVGARCTFAIKRTYLIGQSINPKTGRITTDSPFEGALENLKETK